MLSRYCPMDRVTRIKTTILSPYPLTAIYIDTHNTKTFRFGLPADATLDLLLGDHLYVSHNLHQRVGDTVLMSGPRLGGHWVGGRAKRVGFVAVGGIGRRKRANHC
jgi:cytochrome-b5 reductase